MLSDKSVRVIIKHGLKLLVPAVGSLAVDVAEAVAGDLLDSRKRRAATELIETIVKRAAASMQEFAAGEHLADADLSIAVECALRMIGSTPRAALVWADAGYDVQAAVDLIVSAHRAEWTALDEAQQRLCRELLRTALGAVAAHRPALDETEAVFRAEVLATLRAGAASAAAARDPAVGDALCASVLGLPTIQWDASFCPPGALLRADLDRPVPFHGREAEIEDLMSWCGSEEFVGIRLYTAAGGVGKTRLLREAVRAVRAEGWLAGFLDGAIPVDADPVWRALTSSGRDLLCVIDYAETRRVQTRALLRKLTLPPAARIRIVLLARAADDWWDALRSESGAGGLVLQGNATQAMALRQSGGTLESRTRSWELAIAHFRNVLGRAAAEGSPDLSDPAFERMLLLQVAALAAVEGVPTKGEQGLLGYLLQRERGFWRTCAESRGIQPSLLPAVGSALAAVTLAGGIVSRNHAVMLLGSLPDLQDQPKAVRGAVAELLHSLYGGTQWIEPILPDLLGEHLVQLELDRDSDGLLSIVLDQPT